jgi:hypothetical protein
MQKGFDEETRFKGQGTRKIQNPKSKKQKPTPKTQGAKNNIQKHATQNSRTQNLIT